MDRKAEYKSLISTLANASTKKANALLVKYNKEVAGDTNDLKIKLAKLYAEAPDKIQVEKDFAQIHPHYTFLAKYVTEKKVEKPKEVDVKAVEDKLVKQIVAHDGYSNANGSEDNFLNACGCGCQHCRNRMSGFDGPGNQGSQKNSAMDYIGIIGMVGVIGVAFYVITKTVK